jgi:osmotically-inducible protein OsmY
MHARVRTKRPPPPAHRTLAPPAHDVIVDGARVAFSAFGKRRIEMANGDRGPQPSYRGRGPKNYQRSDDRIREDVCERLAMDHDVDASDIEVSVAEGVVTLNGSVNERYAKRLSEDICESVRGVKDVQNNLRISR